MDTNPNERLSVGILTSSAQIMSWGTSSSFRRPFGRSNCPKSYIADDECDSHNLFDIDITNQ